MPEQGQPPPDPQATPADGQQPPPDQGTASPAGGASEATGEAQASAERDDSPAGEPKGEAAPPTPPPVSWSGLDPDTRRRLLDEADPEELRKHERVAGLSGQMAERLYRRRVGELSYDDLPEAARERLAEEAERRAREREQTEAERQLGQQGEFYSLGQKRWEELQRSQTDEQKRRAEQQAESRVLNGFQQSVQSWATENFPPEVLDTTAAALRENTDMEKLDFKGQYNLWLKTLIANAQEHSATTRIQQERQKWEKDDLPTYRDRWLAERNGAEPSPETDGGPAPGVRELTDEIIAGMDLEEFKAVWDLKRDKPKEGYRYRSTRGIDPRQAQRAGRAQ
jgi:hypothetical protein